MSSKSSFDVWPGSKVLDFFYSTPSLWLFLSNAISPMPPEPAARTGDLAKTKRLFFGALLGHMAVLIGGIPLLFLLNLQFWYYYIPSRDYARQPLFNHFDLNFSRIRAQPFKLPFFAGTKLEQGERHADNIWVRYAPQTAHPRYIAHPPTSYLSP